MQAGSKRSSWEIPASWERKRRGKVKKQCYFPLPLWTNKQKQNEAFFPFAKKNKLHKKKRKGKERKGKERKGNQPCLYLRPSSAPEQARFTSSLSTTLTKEWQQQNTILDFEVQVGEGLIIALKNAGFKLSKCAENFLKNKRITGNALKEYNRAPAKSDLGACILALKKGFFFLFSFSFFFPIFFYLPDSSCSHFCRRRRFKWWIRCCQRENSKRNCESARFSSRLVLLLIRLPVLLFFSFEFFLSKCFIWKCFR